MFFRFIQTAIIKLSILVVFFPISTCLASYEQYTEDLQKLRNGLTILHQIEDLRYRYKNSRINSFGHVMTTDCSKSRRNLIDQVEQLWGTARSWLQTTDNFSMGGLCSPDLSWIDNDSCWQVPGLISSINQRIVNLSKLQSQSQSERQKELAALNSQNSALTQTLQEFTKANKLSEERARQAEERNRQAEERARLAEERGRKQDARLEEITQQLRLLQAQMAPGPTLNSEVDGGSDNESQTSFAPSTTSNHWEKLKQPERNSK